MANQFIRWLGCFLLGVSFPLSAQVVYDMRGADKAPDIALPSEPIDISTVQEPRLALYKPKGDGPFPALVLMHQCGGLGRPDGPWKNMSMLEWAREGVARGYVVLQMDSLNPRNVGSVCQGPKNDVFPSRGIRDALLAASHVRKLPFVDPKRVAYAGFSWGGGVGLGISTRRSAELLGVPERYDAVASVYPPCVYYPKNGAPYTAIMPGIDKPLLVLLGGKDDETPPGDCTRLLTPLKDAGEKVEWHLYPDATHCWDCKNLHGRTKTDIKGTLVEYLHDEAVTKDSIKRTFEFFEKAFVAR